MRKSRPSAAARATTSLARGLSYPLQTTSHTASSNGVGSVKLTVC